MSWLLFDVGLGALALSYNSLFPWRWWPIRAVSFLTQVAVAELAMWMLLGVVAVTGWLALRTDALAGCGQGLRAPDFVLSNPVNFAPA